MDSDKKYKTYRARRFTFRRQPVAATGAKPVSAQGREAYQAASEAYAEKISKPKPRCFSGLWFARKAITLFLIAGMGIFLYAAWTFGFGYYQAKVGQGELRSLFSITGSGAVDPDYLRDAAATMAADLGYLDPVGELSIPGIDCNWMIVEGSDDAALTKGPGHIEETQLPGMNGNFAVAGDRVLYGAPFLHLDEVAVGDEIKVTMPYATFVYQVRETFVVTPDDVSVLEPVGYDAITLLTCDPPWDVKRRIVVRGELDVVLPAGSGY
jgi:sortase A